MHIYQSKVVSLSFVALFFIARGVSHGEVYEEMEARKNIACNYAERLQGEAAGAGDEAANDEELNHLGIDETELILLSNTVDVRLWSPENDGRLICEGQKRVAKTAHTHDSGHPHDSAEDCSVTCPAPKTEAAPCEKRDYVRVARTLCDMRGGRILFKELKDLRTDLLSQKDINKVIVISMPTRYENIAYSEYTPEDLQNELMLLYAGAEGRGGVFLDLLRALREKKDELTISQLCTFEKETDTGIACEASSAWAHLEQKSSFTKKPLGFGGF